MSGAYRNIANPHNLAEPIGNIAARMFEGDEPSTARVDNGLLALSQAAAALHERMLNLGTNPPQESLLQVIYPQFERGLPACESPIEKAMLGDLMGVDYEQGQAIYPLVFDCKTDPEFPDSSVVICPQFPFIRFRIDFMVIVKHGDHRGQFVCEADGQEYHDRNNDKTRDTLMYSAGVVGIHRATGTELMGKPNAAVAPLADMVEEWRQSLG